MGMRWIGLVLAIGLLVCGGARAQQQVPRESLTRIQEVFGAVRDQLWDRNDTYWHRGEFNRGIATMRLITRINPWDIDAYEGAAWLMDSDLREEDAEAFLREGLANNPDVYDLYYELGTFCYFRTRYNEAIVFYSGAVSFAETPLFVRHMLAHAYEKNGDIGDSLDVWLQSEAAEPDSPIPPMHIERIMEGGEPSQVPDSIARSIQHRKEEAAGHRP